MENDNSYEKNSGENSSKFMEESVKEMGFSYRDELSKAKRVVIKLGTSSVSDGLKQKFDFELMEKLAEEIKILKEQGKEIIIVSSGAIGLGNFFLGWEKAKKFETVLHQTAAAVGQNILMNSFTECFKKSGLNVSQLLLTYEDLNTLIKKSNIRILIEKMISLGIVPIINENDAISTGEISFGDNDILSAYVSNITEADLLILLSNVNGLYEDLESKKVIGLVKNVGSDIRSCVSSEMSRVGRGGMDSKLTAAQMAAASKTLTVVANSRESRAISKILAGENVGTLFYLIKE